MDVDTGIDDSLAISYASSLENVELIGITTSFGNVVVDYAVKNTLNILKLLNREDVPVYRGAEHSLLRDYKTSDHLYKIHGLNGVGNVDMGEPNRKVEDKAADDFLVEATKKYGNELAIVAVGPLTNLANAIKKDKEAISTINKIVIMGGAVTVPGNITRLAEANIYADPEAAKFVFESGVPITVVGLDVTLKTFITGEDIKSWNTKTPIGKALSEMATYYYTNEYDGVIGGAMHDPLAVDIAVNPDVVTDLLPINLTVETDEPSIGRTIGNFHLLNREKKDHLLITDINAKAFSERFVKAIEKITE